MNAPNAPNGNAQTEGRSEGIARTSATGDGGMHPELLAWSSSLSLDRALVREDLLGSAAHVTMLARVGLVSPDEAKQLRDALLAMLGNAEVGALEIADGEEDIHMAVEAELTRRLGPVAGRLHTARSRNDQIALDLRLHVRSQAAKALAELTALVSEILDRAKVLVDVLIPAYTHRQRAQPTSAAFLMCAWASQLLRAAEVIAFTLTQAQRSPLGSGACSGTSLPIDRQLTCDLLGFAMPTTNALDTVGDRDFALDWSWSAARSLLALSRLATDIIDFSTSEFGLVRLDGRIAAGSSMMPQKKNPDVFELVRGQSARAIGNVVGLLTLVKGLPSGYNRDLQEDRRTLVETGSLLRGAIHAVRLSLPHVHFDSVRGEAALMDGSTQATDLAEVLVRRGVPFREAYKVIGALVAKSTERGTTLAKLLKNDPAVAHAAHPLLDEQALAVLDPRVAVRAKESPGGTGPQSVLAQIESLTASAEALAYVASTVPSLASLADAIASSPLKVSIPSGAPPRQ